MKPSNLICSAALLVAGSAHGQLLETPASPTLNTPVPSIRSLPPSSRFHAHSQGLPPADPKAPDHWRADPKLQVGVDLTPNLDLEAKLTNPNYREGKRFIGLGPRLAKGVPLGKDGLDLEVAARASVVVDDQLTAFGATGVMASSRKYPQGTTTGISPVASVGATYKMNRKQTATAEMPLGEMERKKLSGASNGLAGSLTLGF